MAFATGSAGGAHHSPLVEDRLAVNFATLEPKEASSFRSSKLKRSASVGRGGGRGETRFAATFALEPKESGGFRNRKR